MSDLQSTLDAIDQIAVHECGWCRNQLADDGPSPYFCNERCQESWALHQRVPVKPDTEPRPVSRPLDIHILPRPLCTCTMCSHPAVRPARAEIFVGQPGADATDGPQWESIGEGLVIRIEPDLEPFRRALSRAGQALAALAGIPADLLGWSRPPQEPEPDPIEDANEWPGPGYLQAALTPLLVNPPDPVRENIKERALQLRRTRNTGPRPRQRAPRRIDARRTR